MTFTRGRHPINPVYTIEGTPLKRVTEIKDLGTWFDPQLTFNQHIIKVCNDARRCLGFVIRQAKLFTNKQAICVLYNAFVRSKLETNASIWSPHEQQYTLAIEKVQKSFVRFLYNKVNGYYPYLYPTLFIIGMVGYASLEARRNIQVVKYFLQLIRGSVSNPTLLAMLTIRVPPRSSERLRTRCRGLFTVPPARTRALESSPVHQALMLLNDILTSDSQLDIFHTSENRFLTASSRYLESIVTTTST
jgi:hypothetical protein